MSETEEKNISIESGVQYDTEIQLSATEKAKRQAKIDALLRYSNDQPVVQEIKPIKTKKQKIKEALVGISTILFMFFTNPFNDKKVARSMYVTIAMRIMVLMFAYWLCRNVMGDYHPD